MLSGKVILVRLEQLLKAELPIEVIPSGKVMLERLEQFLKALSGILSQSVTIIVSSAQ